MKITTKTGDGGKTCLFKGSRVSKGSPVIDVIGEIDELQAVLGLLSSVCEDDFLRGILAKVMDDLYVLMGLLSGYANPDFGEKNVEFLEKYIEDWQDQFADADGFLRPSGNEFALRVNLARTVCRRAERAYARHMGNADFGVCGMYLNRLSDLLFMVWQK